MWTPSLIQYRFQLFLTRCQIQFSLNLWKQQLLLCHYSIQNTVIEVKTSLSASPLTFCTFSIRGCEHSQHRSHTFPCTKTRLNIYALQIEECTWKFVVQAELYKGLTGRIEATWSQTRIQLSSESNHVEYTCKVQIIHVDMQLRDCLWTSKVVHQTN